MKVKVLTFAMCAVNAAFALAAIVEESKPCVWQGEAGLSLPYRLRLPAELAPGARYPLVVHLHGAGSRGTNNVAQLNMGPTQFDAWARKRGVEYILVAPQCPAGQKWVDTPWGNISHRMNDKPTAYLSMALDIVDDVIRKYPVDKSRVYVMGISMGGYATWEVLQRRPELFAAAIPMCGGGDDKLAWKIRDVPIWAFHGSADTVVPVCRSRQMVAALWSVDGNIRYREYPGVGHACWTSTLADASVFEWLFSQRKAAGR